jgi:hypothetical protein
MKTTLALVVFALGMPAAAGAQDGRIQLEILDRLAARASEKQEVTIDASMIGVVVPSLAGPKADAAKQLLSELKGIFVRHFEFDDPKAYSMDDVNTLRKQLAAPGWARIVSSEEKDKDGNWELAEVYLFQPGGRVGGIVVIAAEPGELSVVNIVGPIDLQKINELQGVLGIPRIPGVR